MAPRFHLIAPSLLLIAALPLVAADDPKPFPDMAPTIGDLLESDYFDATRYMPRHLIERALRRLENAEVSIDTAWDGEVITLNIGGSRQTIKAPAPRDGDLDGAMQVIEEVRKRIEATDLPPVRRRELAYELINGALLALDPHTGVMAPEPAKRFSEEIDGKFYGIGAFLEQKEGEVMIVRVMPGLPAEKAGVEDGDVILGVDGEKTTGLILDQVVKRIKGDKGTTVTLTVERKATERPFEIPVVRDLVQVITMRHARSGDVGYVRMDEFNANTARDLLGAIVKLQESGPLKAFVLDLRFNGGGLLDQAKIISDFFLPKGKEIVRTLTSGGETTIHKSSTRQFLDVPMAVLVSGASASAAEIVSGALQRNDRAVVFGSTTFGKGSVQTVRPLKDGSRLKLTIQEYRLPGNVSIQDVGVTPDVRLNRRLVREDKRVDLQSFTMDREQDDEAHLANLKPYQHESAYELGWVGSALGKDEAKQFAISARQFRTDQEASLVIELLQAAAGEMDFAEAGAVANKADGLRQFLLERLKAPIAARKVREAEALSQALGKAETPVTWGPDAVPAAGTLTLAYTGPAAVTAGESAALTFTVANAGTSALGRLYGVIRADRSSPLWEDEVVFGAVPAGGSTTGTIAFKVPPRAYDGEERVTLDLFVDGSRTAIANTPVAFIVKGQPRPHFSFSWKIETPAGDGVIIPGADPSTLELTLINDGDAPSQPPRLAVYKDDDPYVVLGEGPMRFPDAIPKGGSVTRRIPLTVLKEVGRRAFTGDSVKLQVDAEERFPDEVDASYRATLAATITIPVNKPVAGRTVRQPKVSLSGSQVESDGRVRLTFAIADDNPRFVALFQDRDKIGLEPVSALLGTGAVRTYEYHLTPKPGVNHVRLVVADHDDVDEVLPLRVWGAEAPITAKPVVAGSPVP